MFLFFVVAQILGMYVGAFITEDAKTNEVLMEMKIVEDGGSPLASFQMILYILIGTAIMLVLIKFYKGELLFMMVEFGAISMTTSIVVYSFVRLFLQTEVAMAGSIFCGLMIGTARLVTKKWKNFFAVIAAAGAGAGFGFSLSLGAAFLFLLLLTIYDYIAVSKTKHMVVMADEMIKKDIALIVSQERTVMVGGKPKKERIDIGTGDFLAPIMVEVAAYKIGMGAMIIGFVGALAGFWIMVYYLLTHKKIIPAMPPITLGIWLAYAAALVLGYFI